MITAADMLAALGGKAKLETLTSSKVTWGDSTLYVQLPSNRGLVFIAAADEATLDVRYGARHERCMLETLPIAFARIIK